MSATGLSVQDLEQHLWWGGRNYQFHFSALRSRPDGESAGSTAKLQVNEYPT